MAKFRGATLSCRACGEVFKVSPSRAKTAKYCSKACADLFRSEMGCKPKVKLVCIWCEKTFEEHQSHAAGRKYCSNECRYEDPLYREGLSERTLGKSNPMWRGGTSKHPDGYLYEKVRNHPFSSRDYVLQHRLVLERHLVHTDRSSPLLVSTDGGIFLSPDVVVHHKDFNRLNNNINNLEAMSRAEHMSLHNSLKTKRS